MKQLTLTEIRNHILTKETFLHMIVIVFSILFIWVGSGIASAHLHLFDNDGAVVILQARVDSVGDGDAQKYTLGGTETIEMITFPFTATISKGELEGLQINAVQTNDPLYGINLEPVKPGDKVMVFNASESGGGEEWVLHGYVRTDALILLGIIFMALLVLFGRGKGFRTIVAIACTCLAIFTILIPAILSGYNIYAAALIVAFFIVSVTLMLVNGYNLKSLSAGIGCLGGLAVAGILIFIMDFFLKLTGYLDEESFYLTQMGMENPIDLKAIIFASIVIGAMGATLDVGISIAASLSEMYEKDDNARLQDIIKSGLNIGRDILGTMCNTLLLAYIGSSLSTILLLSVYNNSLMELLNREMIVVEILQSLIGSMGLLFTIPLTAAVYAAIYTGKVFKRQKLDKAIKETP